ncbi:hypothetical protein G7K_0334-t2 [Saitoella complicata NRRL Y-17804]|uniref:Derlin n=1 Tax=Saitoella complicata (strain BCRC 22490 / CBS 7301 / JCM 7358 / NBRC 10748 / NRRL Y-17804) TaxID=698492 RepID=A0A0E9N851_SAICN|nr:hypothetical protein G7K_0334-t2 [Saitoella complicata NRRL Y-17804]
MDAPRGQNDFARWYYGLPPVSRTVLFASFLTSIAPLLQLIHPYQIFNIWPMTFKGQLWRPFTASLYAGGGIEMLMGLFFFYNHSTDLETKKFMRTADYAFFLTFCWAIIVVSPLVYLLDISFEGNVCGMELDVLFTEQTPGSRSWTFYKSSYAPFLPCLSFRSRHLGSGGGLYQVALSRLLHPKSFAEESCGMSGPLLEIPDGLSCSQSGVVVISYFIDGYLYFNAVSMSVAYVWSQMNRDRQMSFMGFIPMKAMWLPVSMLVMTFVMNGPGSAFQMQLVGLVAGHTYLFVTEIYPGSHGVRPLIHTPTWFARLFGNAGHARMRTMPYGTAFNPRDRQTGAGDAAAGQATGFGSATSNSTAFRGAGHRLGDS